MVIISINSKKFKIFESFESSENSESFENLNLSSDIKSKVKAYFVFEAS